MKNLVLQYDSWYIALCFLAGLVYAFVLYYKQAHLKEKSRFLVYFLFILRFLSVSIISFLLLSPLFKIITEQKSKPIIVLAQDYSASLSNNYDSIQLNQLNKKIHEFKNKLSDKYEVQEYSLGEDLYQGLRDTFNLKGTNISKYLQYINRSFDNKELSAVILSSDGIFNEGINPDYIDLKFTAPIYTIALGDTTVKKDLFINNVFYNNIAFLNDKTAIKIDFQAKNAKGNKTNLFLYSIGNNGQAKLIDKKIINIDSKDFFNTEYFTLTADRPGINQYRLSLSSLENEVSYLNNSKDIFIQVIDSRIKILLFANSPHPDLGAIKDALTTNKNYVVSIKYPHDSFKPEEFDLIVYHNLPSSNQDISVIHKKALSKNIPEFYIVGSQTDINRFNKYQDVVKIEGNSKATNEVQAIINQDFKLFVTDDFVNKGLENFPPLISPFGEYSVTADSRILLFQKINNINTKYPLLLLNTNSANKTAILMGCNIYKWRLYNYFQYKNIDILKSLLNQVSQYLTTKKDKSQWRVQTNKNIYNETENIEFYAELYNDNYEPINTPEAYLKIISSGSKEFDFVFSREENHYRLNANTFPAGSYRYIARVKYEEKPLIKKGRFSIKTKDLEKFDLVANHLVLNKLSSNSGGELFQENQIDNLINKLDSKDAKSIIYYGQKTKKLVDFKWLFWFFIFLLSLEWFIRRYNGTF